MERQHNKDSIFSLQKAMEFVVQEFSGINRKGLNNYVGLPYVTHCFDVMKLGHKWGAGNNTNMMA